MPLFVLTLIGEAGGATPFVLRACIQAPRQPRLCVRGGVFLIECSSSLYCRRLVFRVFLPVLTLKESDAPVSPPLSGWLTLRVAFDA